MNFIHEIAWHQTGRISTTHHRHTDYDSLELIQVLDGGGSALIGDQLHPLSPGTLLFIDSSNVHAILPDCDSRYCRNKLLVGKNALFQSLFSLEAAHILDIFTRHGGCSFVPDPQTAASIDEIFRHVSINPQNSTALWAIFQLIHIAETAELTPAPRTDLRIHTVLQYIRQHFREPLTIQLIAQETMLSKYYLCHLFREHTGMTVMQYLNEQRLAAARQLLLQTNRPIVEIAQDCGFAGASHFCTFFRKEVGMSPRDFRKKTLH